MTSRHLRHLFFALLLAAGTAPAAAGAPKTVGDPSLKLVAVPASGSPTVERTARRAGPANDEVEGATNLGKALPISHTFSFGTATAGAFEMDARARASLWFRFTAPASDIYAVTLAPTTSGPSAPLSLVLGDGMTIDTTGFASSTATLASPLKISVKLNKGEIYYVAANLLASTTSLRALDLRLNVVATPDGVILNQLPQNPRFVRKAASDTFDDGFYGEDLVRTEFYDGGENTRSVEMSGSVVSETGPKDVVTVTGLERRVISRFSQFVVNGKTSGMPASLKTQGIFRMVVRTVDHTSGITLAPQTAFLMTDLGGAAASIETQDEDALPVRAGAPWVKTIYVRTMGSVPATGCMAMSDRSISWRWYDQTGATALAAAKVPVAIAPNVWRRLVVSVPTSKSRLEDTRIGLAVDCTNTNIVPIETTLTTTLVPDPKVSVDIIDGGKRLDFFSDVARNVDVRIKNGGTAAAVVRLSVGSPFVLNPTSLMQSCLIVTTTCTKRFAGSAPTFSVGAGKTVTLRIFVRPFTFVGQVGPDYVQSRLTAKALVRVRTVFEQQIFWPSGSDFAAVTMNCPKLGAEGNCPAL